LDWAKLQQFVQKFELNQGTSQVHPDVEIAFEVQVSSASVNDKGTIEKRLQQIVQQRLAADGLKLGKGGSTRLLIVYGEKPQGALTSLKIAAAGNKTETKSVSGATATVPELELRWFNDELKKAIWTRKVSISPRDVVCTSEQARLAPEKAFAAAALDEAVDRLSGVALPYFISQSFVGGNDLLPVTTARLR